MQPEQETTPKRRAYKDRLGRLITDPNTIEGRFVMEHIRRAENRSAKAGKAWPCATVGEVATTTKLPPERIVAIVREFGPSWLIGVVEDDDKPMAEWGVFQDGE